MFAATNPSIDDYGEKIEFFSSLSEELRTQSYIDVGCIRLDYSEYKYKLLERCEFWHSIFGKQFLRECDEIMMAFSKKITVNGSIYLPIIL